MPVHTKDVSKELQLDPKVRKQIMQRLSKEKLQKMLEQMFLPVFLRKMLKASIYERAYSWNQCIFP